MLREAFDKLGGLFDDGKVGGEVGVEGQRGSRVGGEPGVDFAGEVRARRISKSLAEGYPHGGGNLHGAKSFSPIQQSFPDGGGLIVPRQSRPWGQWAEHWPHRMQGDSASAISPAGAMRVWMPRSRKEERPDILLFLANLETTPAFDAFAELKHDGSGGAIRLQLAHIAWNLIAVDAKVSREGLQLARSVAPAGEAGVGGMIGEDQLEGGAPPLP